MTRRTRLTELVARHSTRSQARFRVTAAGGDWADLEAEQSVYDETLEALRKRLGDLARTTVLERSFLPTHVFGPDDVLVCVGQDGLVANSLKYAHGQYVLGVNPDPRRFDGVLLGWPGRDVDAIVAAVESALGQGLPARKVTMGLARLSDGQTLRCVNDFFVGVRDHGSARYRIRMGEHCERQSSSGVIVATGLGSTGWLKSILTTSGVLQSRLGQGAAPEGRTVKLAWDERSLVFSVREAFPSKWTQAGLVFGRVTKEQQLVIASENSETGVIFSDGMHRDAMEFNAPLRVEIGLAAECGKIGWPTAATETGTRRDARTNRRPGPS